MPIRARRKRYLLYNVILWLTIGVGAAVSLFVLRHYGNALAARHGAFQMLAGAQDALARGDYESAQNQIAEALNVYPGGLSDVMLRFGPTLLLMPVAEDAIERSLERLDAGVDLPDQSLRVRVQILFGKSLPDDVNATLRRPADDPGMDLLRGRWCMNQGKLQEAWTYFNAYWQVHEPLRRETLSQLSADGYGDDDVSKAFVLLDMGLWIDAAIAGASLPEGPDRAAIDGFAALAKGERQAAERLFYAALRERPNHFYALLGLKGALDMANPMSGVTSSNEAPGA